MRKLKSMLRHDHIAIAVSDFSTTLAFYKAIGAKVVSKPSERFLEVVIGEVRLHFINACSEATGTAENKPRIDHLCLRVDSFSQLEALQDIVNQTEAAKKFGSYKIQKSPPLGPGETQCEERPPLATLYFRDPDGIGLEARCYE